MHPEQKSRWLNDNRTFAPWQYAEEAMLPDADEQLHVPQAEAKEQFHQLPPGYTRAADVSNRARHRMLANGWHIGTSKFIMMLVLQMLVTASASSPTAPPRQSSIQMAVGPGGWKTEATCVREANSMWSHWELACSAVHPMARPPQLEPALRQCLTVQQQLGGSLNRLRREVIDETDPG